jgi:hypothetical protein
MARVDGRKECGNPACLAFPGICGGAGACRPAGEFIIGNAITR